VLEGLKGKLGDKWRDLTDHVLAPPEGTQVPAPQPDAEPPTQPIRIDPELELAGWIIRTALAQMAETQQRTTIVLTPNYPDLNDLRLAQLLMQFSGGCGLELTYQEAGQVVVEEVSQDVVRYYFVRR